MNKEIKEKIREIIENLGYEIENIKEITNQSEIQKFVYELENEEYEIPGLIEKFYLVKTTEEGIFYKVPVIDEEIEEELILECNEEDDFEKIIMMMKIY